MRDLAIDWQGEYASYDRPETWLPELEKRKLSPWILGQTILANHNAGRFRVRVVQKTVTIGSAVRLMVEGITPLAPLAILSGRLNGDPLGLFGKIVVSYKEELDALVRIPPDTESGTYVFLAQQWEPGGQPAYPGGALIYPSSVVSVEVKTHIDATDEAGKRQGVTLELDEYERLLLAAEDLEDLRAADEALQEIERGEDQPIPWEQVRDRIGSEYEGPEDP